MYNIDEIDVINGEITIRGSHWDGIGQRDYNHIRIGNVQCARIFAQEVLDRANDLERELQDNDRAELERLMAQRSELNKKIEELGRKIEDLVDSV